MTPEEKEKRWDYVQTRVRDNDRERINVVHAYLREGFAPAYLSQATALTLILRRGLDSYEKEASDE